MGPLKPCPGCGRADRLTLKRVEYKTYAVACTVDGEQFDCSDDGCGWQGPAIASDQASLAKEGAREHWNRRAASPSITKRNVHAKSINRACALGSTRRRSHDT